MKVKLKLDLQTVKNWLLEHGEKVAFVIVGIVFLLFTYSAVSREVLEATKQPDDLKQLAATVTQHVANSKFDKTREKVQVVDYTKRATSKPVNPDQFVLVRAFNRPIHDDKVKRGNPEVLGAEELRVAAGFDVFSVKSKGEEGPVNAAQQFGDLHPQPWAVVTAIVPVLRQQQEYDRAFANAVGPDPTKDVPRYFMPKLERIEVDPAKPDDPAKPEKWDEPSPGPLKVEATWSDHAQEIVSPKYIDPELTGHLGQLVYSNWGEAVSHPKVLLEGQEPKTQNSAAPQEPPAAAPEAAAAAPPPAAPEFRMHQKAVQRKPEQAPKPAAAEPAEQGVQYRLLRIFDYTVQPGKKYRYRVTLALANPNFGRLPLHLETPENAAKEYLVGKPSPPTGVVTIPDGYRILAGPVDAGSRFTEPSATVVVTTIDRQNGLQAGLELKTMRRGSIANRRQEKVEVEHPGTKQITSLVLDFQSNTLVLDMFGGRPLGGRRKTPPSVTPGEVLLLDAQGNMTIGNELDDQHLFATSVVRAKPEPPPRKEKDDDDGDKKKGKSGKALPKSPPRARLRSDN